MTVTAVEESRLLTWNRTALDKFLKKEAFLQAVFHNLIGKDITTKLYQVQDLLVKDSEQETSGKMRANPSSVVGFRHRLMSSNPNLAKMTASESKGKFQQITYGLVYRNLSLNDWRK